MCFLSLICALLVSVPTHAQDSPSFEIGPVWKKINGEWNYDKDDKTSHQILLHITTTKHKKQSKDLLIKELVKLPFVIYLPQGHKVATPLK